jgi:acyl-CoA synthetase (AMP-forming)/AMP-acid ligase II
MLGSTAPEPQVDIDPVEDVAALPYSSGTTGVPKGVMLTHRSIATNLSQLAPCMPMGPGDRILAVLPFFHIYGLTALMIAPLRQGATVVVLPRFDLDTFLGAIEKHRITGLYVAPPIVLALAKHPAVDGYDLSSLKYVISAAAPLDAELAAACSRRLGLPPVGQAYGMTELSPGTHVVPLDAENPPPGSVGKLIAGTEMRIISLDDPHKDVGVGERGEIVIRGPQVMKGYLGRPEATAAMIDADGWLHTGDVGYADEGGWLYVVDRVKELIKYKGFQVAPAELEALLLTHPGIADAAVIGVYDTDNNERPHAYVVRQPTAEDLTEGEVMEYVAARVAPYKKIRRVVFIDGVPRAASGKILRRELRERA